MSFATVLFGSPHNQLATRLLDLVATTQTVEVVTGFATVEGVYRLIPALRGAPTKLRRLVIGAGTQRAFDAIDTLFQAGVERTRVRTHLGHSRESNGKYKFYQYHPMLHSKIYLFDMGSGKSSAIIGSHNLTGFALGGLNGEAAVLLEGSTNDPELIKVRSHIDHCWAEAVEYRAQEKEAYVWWFKQFLHGLQLKVVDRPRVIENKKTVVILCSGNRPSRPGKDQTVYFEIPSTYRQRAIGAEVHMYLFDPMPLTPRDAIASISSAQCSVWGKLNGLSDDPSVSGIKAHWYVSTDRPPEVIRVDTGEHHPGASAEVQQSWMKASHAVRGEFLYYFNLENSEWIPEYDHNSRVQLPPEYADTVSGLNFIPSEDQPYFRVTGLREDEEVAVDNEWYRTHSSPEIGSFILLSPRRAVLS